MRAALPGEGSSPPLSTVAPPLEPIAAALTAQALADQLCRTQELLHESTRELIQTKRDHRCVQSLPTISPPGTVSGFGWRSATHSCSAQPLAGPEASLLDRIFGKILLLYIPVYILIYKYTYIHTYIYI